MLILGIESTCDETACSVVQDGKKILSNVVSSQVDLHGIYGGVVPELACRRHIDVILPVVEQALNEACVELTDIDGIGVAHGPGLLGALHIGLNFAKGIAWSLRKPLIGVNHIEAHLYASIMSHSKEVLFPAIGVVLSGGHTALVLMQGVGKYSLIGQTVDDAVGEAFDKVARILGFPYPGGPVIEELAKQGDASKFTFRGGRVKTNPFAFSFSGLKTAVLYAVKGQGTSYDKKNIISDDQKADVAAAFQEAAFTDIVNKTVKAAEKEGCKTLIFGGGVVNNLALRKLFAEKAAGLKLLWPASDLTLDNAAMIAGLAYHKLREKPEGDPLDLEAMTTIDWDQS